MFITTLQSVYEHPPTKIQILQGNNEICFRYDFGTMPISITKKPVK